MSRLPWKDAEIVSSESVYVVELVRGINTVVGVVRESVELKKYTRSICDKIVGYVAQCGFPTNMSTSLVLAKFTQTVVRCRPLAQTAAEQVSCSFLPRRADNSAAPPRPRLDQDVPLALAARTRRHGTGPDLVSPHGASGLD